MDLSWKQKDFEILAVNGYFAALFLGSALLFGLAGRAKSATHPHRGQEVKTLRSLADLDSPAPSEIQPGRSFVSRL